VHDVEVDVGRLGALERQKALEQKPHAHGSMAVMPRQ
jgi:hypothetical protein